MFLRSAVELWYMGKREEQIATRVDDSTKRDFRVAAAKRDMDMSELLRQIIEDFLESDANNTAHAEDTEGNLNATKAHN